jgi:hypothetical protein
MVNLVTIDSKFDFGKENEDVSALLISKIIIDEPNNLLIIAILGIKPTIIHKIDLVENCF